MAIAADGDGLNCNGCDINGLDGDGGRRQCATVVAADDGGAAADNRQQP